MKAHDYEWWRARYSGEMNGDRAWGHPIILLRTRLAHEIKARRRARQEGINEGLEMALDMVEKGREEGEGDLRQVRAWIERLRIKPEVK
jgi:hypothetical protein